MSTKPYNAWHFAKLARALRMEKRQPCWLCDQPIDYTLQYPHPESFSADHLVPVSHAPHLALDYSNLRQSHLSCNKERGNRLPAPGLGNALDQW